jgi:futalosine hydrolase
LILVVCALLAELRGLPPRKDVEVFSCGVGPVEAASSVARKLARDSYDSVVNAGIAGAFPGVARVGDALVVGEEIMADFGLEGGGEFALPDGAQITDRAFADAGLLARCSGLGLSTVRGLTVSAVTTTRATGERFARTYAPGVESMEGFAVLRSSCAASRTTWATAPKARGIFAPARARRSAHSKRFWMRSGRAGSDLRRTAFPGLFALPERYVHLRGLDQRFARRRAAGHGGARRRRSAERSGA